MVITDFGKLNIESLLTSLMDPNGKDENLEFEFSIWDYDSVKRLKDWGVKKLPAFAYAGQNKFHILQGCSKDPLELVKCSR